MKWQIKKISDVGKIYTGKTPKTSDKSNFDGNIPFATPSDLHGKIIEDTNRHISEKAMQSLAYVREGSTLVGCIGDVGKVGYASVPMTFNQQINAIEWNNEIIYDKYGYYTLLYMANILKKKAVSSVVPILNKTNFSKIQIPIPPLTKQKQIVKLLDIAENIIKLREHTILKLDLLSKSLLEETLGNKDNLAKEKKLGDACDVRDGTHDSPKYVKEGFPLVTSKNLKDGFVDLSKVKLISKEDFNEVNKRSKVDHKDILMPMIGTIGNPVYIEDIKPKFAIKNVALIKSKKNSPNQIYIKSLLENKLFLKYINKVSRGGTQKFLGLSDIRKFPIPILKEHVENKIVDSINKIIELKKKYLLDLTKRKKLIKSIQQQVFEVV